MAFQTGSVNSLADIQTTIRTFLQANGWSWDSGNSVIYKDQIFIKFVAPAGDKCLFTAQTAITGGTSASQNVGLGRLAPADTGGFVSGVIVYPATYYMFLDSDEFYFVLLHSSNIYQFVMWGKSSLNVGAGGTGTYISGSVSNLAPYSSAGSGSQIALYNTGGGTNAWWGQQCPAPFWRNTSDVGSGYGITNDFVHTNLDGATWDASNGATQRVWVGASSISNLITVMPNIWNGESPFLPVRCYKIRPSNMSSLVVDLKNARYCRIDNFVDGEIITIGSDQWQIFPFYKRDNVNRNGLTQQATHSGTLGWAIRKVV